MGNITQYWVSFGDPQILDTDGTFPPTSNSFFPNIDLSVSFWGVFLIFEEIGAEQCGRPTTAVPPPASVHEIKSHRVQKKQIKPHNSNQIAMSSSSAFSSNNAAPELFKETFASEFGKLVAAGVDKPAAAAQALLAAQRAFQQQQQQQQQETVAPAAPVDDDMQRKGKVAASVSTTAVNFPSAKTMQQVPRCPSHHRRINPQFPHFFRRWRPTDRSGRLSASGACGRFCGSASRSTRTDTSSTSWAAPSGGVVAACELVR